MSCKHTWWIRRYLYKMIDRISSRSLATYLLQPHYLFIYTSFHWIFYKYLFNKSRKHIITIINQDKIIYYTSIENDIHIDETFFRFREKGSKNRKIVQVVLFFRSKSALNESKMAKEQIGCWSRIHHRLERAERNRCFSSARLVTRNGVDFAWRFPGNGRRRGTLARRSGKRQAENSFFFSLSFLSLLLPPPPPFFLSFFLFFFRHLSILCKLSKVCSRRTRGSSILESADRYISSFPFVTSFDSLIQYRFSIASQRISLEGRRIRNSLFSRWKISLSLSFIPIINDRNVFADLWNKFKLLKLSWLAKRTDLSIFKLIELSNIFPLSISNIPPRFLYSRQNMKEKKEFQLKVSWYETSSSI